MDTPLSVDELHIGYKEKKYSVQEVTEHYLARIKTFDSKLNSIITVSEDYARQKAALHDEELKNNPNAFEDFPLLGVPMAVKDVYLTRGIRTTAASRVLENFIPQYSSTAFSRLEAAGAILVGKANCDAWAHGSSGENSDFGATLNPWNTDYIPGGSSSGSGAAVAANFALIAPGTDTCGSVRLPANYCGVTGLKPTYGAVSRYGVVAMASSWDTVGHIARSAKDCETVFKITSGVDGHDATLIDHTYKPDDKKKLRIGLPKEFMSGGLSADVQKAVDDFSLWATAAGHDIVEVSLPSTKYAISVYYIVQPAEVSSNLGRYDGVRYGRDRSAFGMEAKRRIMLGTFVLSSGYYDAYYDKAMRVRTILIREVDEAFDKVDVILAPVAPTPPFKLGEKIADPLAMYLTDIYAATANLSGIPSLAIPTGFTANGLPLGIQIMGKKFQENTLFTLAKDYQSQTDFHLKTPTL